MRIIINVEEAKDANGKRAVRLRMGYQQNGGDGLRVTNCGIEIYNLLKEGFENSLTGGIMLFEGEKR